MIHLPASVRVYLCLTACDMRKSFDSPCTRWFAITLSRTLSPDTCLCSPAGEGIG
jgi:hypothetical protein